MKERGLRVGACGMSVETVRKGLSLVKREDGIACLRSRK